jgi:AcrR family transcriptional regulator
MATRETQTLIIDTALSLFNRHGCSNISTNRIAAECGISRGNLHYHFPKKEEIVQCIFQRISYAMNNEGPDDQFAPTLESIAKMHVRQSLLIHEYEFFYREMPSLLRRDALLRRRYQEYRENRIDEITRFLLTMREKGLMDFGSDLSKVRSLVISSWIISDNWPNFVEFSGRELNADAICEGYDLVLHVIGPFITEDFRSVSRASHDTIRKMVHRSQANDMTSFG